MGTPDKKKTSTKGKYDEDTAETRRILADSRAVHLREHRETLKELSNALDVPYTTVVDWSKGKTCSRMDKIEKMAVHWGVQKSDLIEDKSHKASAQTQEQKELDGYLEVLRTRPEMRILFNLSKDATKEEVEQAVKIIEALRK